MLAPSLLARSHIPDILDMSAFIPATKNVFSYHDTFWSFWMNSEPERCESEEFHLSATHLRYPQSPRNRDIDLLSPPDRYIRTLR
ncbi:hypothetical protein Scep_009299 [Stephania cephalantha]|uniref:Uncharacterized protein n=1 Tax=Stephania cephalantha TaxID=152367 RepID=A0AAP0JSW2_9MAGN